MMIYKKIVVSSSSSSNQHERLIISFIWRLTSEGGEDEDPNPETKESVLSDNKRK